MRVLASTTANDGHAGPVFAFVRAVAEAGHDVAVAAPGSYAQAVAHAGFEHLPFGDAPPELVGPVMSRLPELGFDEADAVVIREVFGRIDAQAALPGVSSAVARWRPDLVLREPAELGALVAAESAGIPHVQVAIGMQEITRRFAELTEGPLVELAGPGGVAEDQLVAASLEEPGLSLVPETLDRAGDEGYREELVVHRFRDPHFSPTTSPLPQWGEPGWPLVYVTFGSVAGSLPPFAGVFRAALDALADDEVRVFMTVGRRFDVADLGALPDNAHVESWWPQDQVLDEAAAMLGHGGFGTTYGALVHGVPQVVAPLFSSDQEINGRHVAAWGVGRTVAPGRDDVVARAAAELRSMLGDRVLTEQARAGAQQVAELPPAADAVAVLAALAG